MQRVGMNDTRACDMTDRFFTQRDAVVVVVSKCKTGRPPDAPSVLPICGANYLSRSRAMIICWISLVPSVIDASFASR